MNAALQVAGTYLAQISTAVDTAEFQQETQSRREDRSVGQVINLMRVGGVQQVMLDIKVAEINRAELKRMNAQFNGMNLSNEWTFGGVNGGASFPDVEFNSQTYTDPLTGAMITTPEGRLPVFSGIAPWGPAIDEFAPTDMAIQNQGVFASFLSQDSLFNMALDIAKENRLAKVLAEPTLTTLTGQEAKFLSGGEIAIPVPQGFDRTTFEFKEFGIIVTFLPIVLDSGLINLKVDVAVSEITRLDPGSLIPLQLGTRRATASVELREGQTMGLAGLIDSKLREAVEKFPGLGNIPLLGALFRSQDFVNEETELVITVTPRLAKPMAPEDVKLPTDNFIEPSDAQFFMLGKLEGRQRSRRGNASGEVAADVAGAEAEFGHQLD
jgi:pilus assembly protein CpaC